MSILFFPVTAWAKKRNSCEINEKAVFFCISTENLNRSISAFCVLQNHKENKCSSWNEKWKRRYGKSHAHRNIDIMIPIFTTRWKRISSFVRSFIHLTHAAHIWARDSLFYNCVVSNRNEWRVFANVSAKGVDTGVASASVYSVWLLFLQLCSMLSTQKSFIRRARTVEWQCSCIYFHYIPMFPTLSSAIVHTQCCAQFCWYVQCKRAHRLFFIRQTILMQHN